MKTMLFLLVMGLVLSPASGAPRPAASQPSNTSPTVEVAKRFLKHLEASKMDEALKLWSAKSLNAGWKKKVEGMSKKIVRLGGIKQLKAPEVEKRPHHLATYETVITVIYGDGNLAFGSFSFAKEDGAFRLIGVRSEQGWGGTTSLFDEEPSSKDAGAAEQEN